MNVQEARDALCLAIDGDDEDAIQEGLPDALDAFEAAIRLDEQQRVLWSEEKLIVAAQNFADSPHVVRIGATDWGIQHPPRCRPALTNCPVHEYMTGADGPPAPEGVYFIDERGNIAPHDGRPDPAIAFLAALEALDA